MTEPAKEWVGFSPQRVRAIALNTLTESARQKVYNILLVFALVVIATASFFAQFNFGETAGQAATEQLKFIKDFCFGAISVFGMLIAVVGTAQLLPNEVEQRTIYTVLSKPVRRFEFLLGKYLGSVLLVLVSLAMMSLMFGAMLLFKEQRLTGEVLREAGGLAGGADQELTQRLLQQIRSSAFDTDIAKGLFLIFIKLGVLAAITLLVSTFSTSMIFNVTVTLMVFFAGHLVGSAKEIWQAKPLLRYLLAIIPDLGMFNIADDIILGHVVPWVHVGKVAVYGLIYLATVVAAAHFIFADREI